MRAMAYNAGRRPEAIPARFAGALVGATAEKFELLARSVSEQLALGADREAVVRSLTAVGWDPSFSEWYVGVYVGGGSVVFSDSFVHYPRVPFAANANWWDRQSISGRKGSGILWFYAICCQCPGIIVGLLLMVFCNTEEGKGNGQRLLTFSGTGLVVSVIIRVVYQSLDASSPLYRR